MMKEIEIKVEISLEDYNIIVSNFKGQMIEEKTEMDIYYTSKHKDFIQSEECLRIRHTDDFNEITWKPETDIEMKEHDQFWKEEINVEIGPNLMEWRALLINLDFLEYCTVIKHRAYFKFDDETKLMLDRVEGAGLFLEIETLSDDVIFATNKNNIILEKIGMLGRNVVRRPYRDLVVERMAKSAASIRNQ